MENANAKAATLLQASGKGVPVANSQVYKERVCFNPHPKTLTMAGDYEYFAAQGHHPLAFALAELVDNALRATKGNISRPRSIVVSLVVDHGESRGLVAVRDNGVGMTPQELNNWAVMNLSMEDRGLLGAAGGAEKQQAAGSRYLSGDISYFGVGSKNAAFYLGRTVKVVTRPPGDGHVHELCIRGAELERRFKAGEAVYEEDMVHRPPGAMAVAEADGAGRGSRGGLASPHADLEEGFAAAASWVAEEVNQPDAQAEQQHSFTRVIIGDLKPEVLEALADEEAALGVLRDLAHLYHYYIHGPKGNAFVTSAAREQERQQHHLPGGEALPDIVVELLTDSCGAPCPCGAREIVSSESSGGGGETGVRWRRRLSDVDDDMESRYLRAARSTLEFSLDVPSMGLVEGVLWYFPFESDQETVPMDDATRSRMALTAAAAAVGPSQLLPGAGGGGAGHGGPAIHDTQIPPMLGGPTQVAGAGKQGGATQRGGTRLGGPELEMQDAATARLLQASPLFEAFWQGRLIPGACVSSLPFLDLVRAKRTAAARDLLPDEVFGRIRGALFFGPGWRVTRNKLMFRDNLPQLLANAVPSDRHLERHAREWLTECHRTLDRSVRFEGMVNQSAQSLARRELGEDVTLFERIHDGLGAVAKGDVVRLATRPQIVGTVLWFMVPRVVHAEGCYSHGKVSVAPLPPEMYGDGSRHTWPIRRIEGMVTKAELAEHVGKEMLKLPSSLRLEPMKLAGSCVLQLNAGATLPESSVEVVNGMGQSMSRAFFSGHRQTLRVVQTLYYLGPGTWEDAEKLEAAAGSSAPPARGAAAGELTNPGADPAEAEAPPAKGKRGRKRKQEGRPEGGEEGGKRAATGEGDAGADATSRKGQARSKGGKSGGKREQEETAEQGNASEAAADDGNKGAAEGQDGGASGSGGGKHHSGRRNKGRSSEGGAASGGGGGGSQELLPLAGAEMVLRVENKTPSHDLFAFQKLKGGLIRAGRYFLEYMMMPELPGGRTLGRRTKLQVASGAAASFDLQGEGRATAQARPLVLGEALPPLRMAFRDSVGNVAGRLPPASAVKLEALSGGIHTGGAVVQDLTVEAEIQVDAEGGCLVVSGLRVVGPPGATGGLSIFRSPAAQASAHGGCSQSGAQRDGLSAAAVGPVELFLAVHVTDMVSQGYPFRLHPGTPHLLQLLPGHPFAGASLAVGGAGSSGGDAQQEAGPAASDDDVVVSTPLEGGRQQSKLGRSKRGGPEAGALQGGAGGLAVVTSGDALPDFQVRVLDAWGNPTAPVEQLPFELAVASAALEPDHSLFPVNDRGIAVVSGVIARRTEATPAATQQPRLSQGADAAMQQVHSVRMWPQVASLPPPAAAASSVEQAEQGASAEEESLALGVVAQSAYGGGLAAAITAPPSVTRVCVGVLPSALPAKLMFIYQGEELQMIEEVSEEDGEPAIVWVLSGRPGLCAGGRAEGLALRCLDEVGRPSCHIKGKLQVSWAKGSCKRGLGGDDVKLPPLPLPEAAMEPVSAWVRFNADPKANPNWPDMSLEVSLRVVPSPGPPASWSMSLVEYGAQQDGGAGGKGGEERDLSLVVCGRPFYLEVQALDQFSNKCSLPPEARPEPRVIAVYESPSAPLQLEDKSKWSQTQAGCDACVFKLFLAGPVGAVKLMVRDESGEDAASLLVPDELTVKLAPGPPAALIFDGPAQLQCGTRGVLGDLRLRAVDAWANLADSAAPFEVSLNGCALPAADESAAAAKVAASGSNRAKVKEGVALFKSVRLSADAPGDYLLRAGSATRKVAVTDAMVTVQVMQQNFVTGLEVAQRSLPGAGTQVGGSHTLQVDVGTEDGRPLPWEAAAASLQLRLEPLGPEAAAGGGGKAAGSGRARHEAIVLLADEEASRAAWEAGKGREDGEEGPEAPSGRTVCFLTPELVLAGRYRATAQFTETRTELLQALPKADRLVRSPTVEFALDAGAPEAAVVEGPSASATAAAVSNAAEPSSRRILKQVAVQLKDGHGNPVALAGAKVRWRLEVAAAGGDEGGVQGAAPQLECEGGAAPEADTDERGRAFFGDIAVAAGTGRVGPGDRSDLECELTLSVQLPGRGGGSSRRKGGGNGSPGWAVCWRCSVLFTDDSARAEALRALQVERDALQQRLSALKERVQEAQKRADSSLQEAKAARHNAERCAGQLGLREVPATSRDAAAALQARREAAAAVEERPPVSASYGPPSSGMTLAIQKCLVSKDPDMVGVFAQLVTVEDRRLAEVMSAAYLAAMQVVVVKTYECISRLRDALGAGRGAPTPSMLSYTLIQPFSPEAEGRAAGRVQMQGVSELASRLMAEASDGADGPLPLVLPHTRMLLAIKERGHQPPRGADLAANQWPPGCLGFAVNLLRPAVKGHRATVMYAQLGRSLVFETMEQAAKYRQLVTQVLRSSMADMFTLDHQKISGRGVVVGSNFRVPPMEETQYRFGSRGVGGASQAGGGLSPQQDEMWQALVGALEQQEAAEARREQRQPAGAAGGAEEGEGLEEDDDEAGLQQRLADVTDRIQEQQRHAGGRGGKGGGKRGGGGNAQAEEEAGADAGGAAPPAAAAGGKGAHHKRRRTDR